MISGQNWVIIKYTNTITKYKNTRISKNKNANLTASWCFLWMYIDFPCLFWSLFVFTNFQSSFFHNHDFFLTIPTFPWLLFGLRLIWLQFLTHILGSWCLSLGHIFGVNQNHPRRLRPSFRKFKIFNIFRSGRWLVFYLYVLIQHLFICARKLNLLVNVVTMRRRKARKI